MLSMTQKQAVVKRQFRGAITPILFCSFI